MERVLILGAKSDIARALAHRFALAGHDIILAARRATDLENDAVDLCSWIPWGSKTGGTGLWRDKKADRYELYWLRIHFEYNRE